MVNYLATTYIVVLFLFLGCSTKSNIQDGNNKSSKTLVLIPQNAIVIKNDSNFKYFGIKDDIIFSDKEYPPKGSRFDYSLTRNNPNEMSEGLAVYNAVLSCFSKDRYKELVKLKASIFIQMFTDREGIIKEVVILTLSKKTFFNENELISMINKVKGLKMTIPPGFIDFKFVKFEKMIWFK
ncbi:MAG: hypothetical protein WCG93_01340 [Paludibacter sp.]